jgi:orotidine-5'-phosphate decarboxylase
VYDPKIIVALDVASREEALRCAAALKPDLCRLKIGKELFVGAGPHLVEELQRCGFQIFLDLKFHDIPHTVARACAAAARLGVWMVNVHALGGKDMLCAAREGMEPLQHKPLLVAVTLLTSVGAQALKHLGIDETPRDFVLRLASLAKDCGLDGAVCSAQEALLLRKNLSPVFLLVTPGIRLAGQHPDDQVRTATPLQAIQDGANYLVVGRPITGASDPLRALERFNQQIESQAGRHS